MALKGLEMRWKTALTSILEDLTESQLQKMLFNLDKIPQGVKSGKVREEIPQVIIQYFGTEGSISVIDKEMKRLPRLDARVQDLLRPFVDKVKKLRQKNKEATSKRRTDSGSVAKKEEAAAAEPSGQPVQMKTTSDPKATAEKVGQDAAQRPRQRRKTDSAAPAKPKEKKPAGSTKTPKVQAAAVKRKPGAKKDGQ